MVFIVSLSVAVKNIFVNSYWKRLWRWVSSQSLTEEELVSILDKNVVQDLREGLASYKPLKPESYTQLLSKYPDQTKLLSVVQTLQNYIVSLFLFIYYQQVVNKQNITKANTDI